MPDPAVCSAYSERIDETERPPGMHSDREPSDVPRREYPGKDSRRKGVFDEDGAFSGISKSAARPEGVPTHMKATFARRTAAIAALCAAAVGIAGCGSNPSSGNKSSATKTSSSSSQSTTVPTSSSGGSAY
jgi:hypothetical protein